MFEHIKRIRESFRSWLVLTALSILGFTGSTISFFSNPNITVVGWAVYLVVASLFLILISVLAIATYNAWLQARVKASIDTRIRSFLSTTEIVDETTHRIEEIVAKRLADPQVVVRESHRQNVYQTFESGARAYGMFYDFQNVHCFVDQDGMARITRHVKLTAYTNVPEFYVFLLLPERDQEGLLMPPRIERIGNGPNLDAGPPVWFLSRRLSTIQINPPLGVGDSVEFNLHEGSTEQVFRTPWKRKKSQTPDDYISWDIAYPTQELQITITLPPDMEIVDITADALYSVGGRTLSRHFQEYDRIKNSAVDTGQGHHLLRLTVDRPLISLKYKLGWLPHPSYAEPIPQGH